MAPDFPALVRCIRIVLTGGPGGGKTTAADLFRRELSKRISLVPEAASLLFSGGFPRSSDDTARRATQEAIFHVQRNLEDVLAATHPGTILLCDRGTVDGAAYWPDGPDGFFSHLGTTMESELARYDAVVFFQSAAVGGMEVSSGNPVRVESTSEAAVLDARLEALWSKHPKFVLVRNHASFIRKIGEGLSALQAVVRELNGRAGRME